MRWLYHLRLAAPAPRDRYAPASLSAEGFVHASFRDVVLESARLHLPAGASSEVLVIDPRLLDVPVELAKTPRGEMPHIHGSIPAEAIAFILPLPTFAAELAGLPDRVESEPP